MFRTVRPFADPELAARRLLQHARAFEPTSDGWIDIEQIRHPFIFSDKASPAEFFAGLRFAASEGWLRVAASGLLVRPINA